MNHDIGRKLNFEDYYLDCLVRLKEKYYIQTDIQKVALEGHRIPIDDELANLLAMEIKQAKELSNRYSILKHHRFSTLT